MLINSELVNYIPTFSRMWELLREEMRVKDVRSLTSRKMAVDILLGERDKLQTQIEHVLTFDSLMGKPVKARTVRMQRKLDRRFRLADDLVTWMKRRKFPSEQFDKFLKQLKPYIRHRGDFVWVNMPWEKKEEAELKRLKESPDKWSNQEIIKIFRGRGKEKHWWYRNDRSVKSKLRRMKYG